MTDKPRLIEVAFPLEQASLTSVHEKNVRHGHISTLHIWPARRPLAACRAALLCTLLPDPGDAKKRQELLDLIGGTVVKKHVTSEDEEGNSVSEEKKVVEGGVLVWGNENAPAMDTLRSAINDFYGGNAPKVLDPFAGGGAIPLEAMRLGCDVTSADLNPVAWFIQKCTLDYPQRFSGKKWPLPDFVREWPDFVEDFIAGKIKKRKGDKKPHFNDEKQYGFDNPAKPLQNGQAAASLPDALNMLPDADLAWHVRAWGRWVLERARQELAARYPMVDGEPTVAYLWARTARDPQTTGRIPLLKTFWLCKKRGKRTALLPVPLADGSGVSFKLVREADFAKPESVIEENEFLRRWEVTPETLESFLNQGTMNRAGVWSPCSGRPGVIALTMKEDLPRQGQQGLLGSQMTAVVTECRRATGNRTFKGYRLPNSVEIRAADVQIEELDEAFSRIPLGKPNEPTPEGGGSGASRAFSLHRYGMKTWGQLFTSRQLLALACLVENARAAHRAITVDTPALAEPVSAYLALCVDRLADYSSAVCSWHNTGEKMRNTFGRFALPMVWDFCEVNPLSETSGNFLGALEWVALYLGHALQACRNSSGVSVLRESAISSSVEPQDVVLTDPPYYDAIPYSDLMDFFYIWLRRTLRGTSTKMDEVFAEPLSPKWNHHQGDGELIDDESRFNGDREASKRNYTDGMAKAFQRCCERLTDAGRLVIVFANKSVDAWETLVGALIRGGADVTASWPIQTEMSNRTRGLSSAALSSSVWIVCRKRAKSAPPGWEELVLERMKQILFERRPELGGINILQYYFDLGIRGPDFIWAALGPALQAYSEHAFVKKTGGGMMTVQEFLDEVRKLVLQFSLGELPGFRELHRETQGRGETVALDPVTQYYLLHRAYFGLQAAPAGACILYANACGKDETELKVVWNILEQGGKSGPGKKGRPRIDAEAGDTEEAAEESSGSEYRLLDWSERVESDDLGESRGGLPSPLVDKLHRLMALFQRNQAGKVQSLYESWGLASERAFPPLLQAIRELAFQDGNETERRLVEALATQLKLTRQQVAEDGMIKDAPYFAPIDEATRAKVSYRKGKK
jgi:adenine-specific DNA methylase